MVTSTKWTLTLHNTTLKTYSYQSVISSGVIPPLKRIVLADVAAPNSSAEFLAKVQFSSRAE